MKNYAMDTAISPINWEPKTLGERIAQNAKNLLMTRMGEVPYDRMRGVSRNIEHKPIAHLKNSIMPEIARVLGYEPDARLVRAEPIQDTDGLRIVCEIEVDDQPEDREQFYL